MWRRSRYNRFMRVALKLMPGLLLLSFSFAAQEPQQPPSAPEPQTKAVPEHRFWDRTNVLLFSGIVVVRGMDYASTRNFMARGRQEIVLPDDGVNNSAGFAALEAAATLTSVGISYIFHRTGNHKMER